MEVESALVEHPAVAEAAVVGKSHDLKGQAIAAFVTLRDGHRMSSTLRDELREFVAQKIGALARPDDVLFSADLPKTRSGKIMRRLLRDIAEGRALGDTTTLADPAVVAALKDQYRRRKLMSLLSRLFPVDLRAQRQPARPSAAPAQARAEETLIDAHVANALMFIDALAEDLSFDRASEFVRVMACRAARERGRDACARGVRRRSRARSRAR